MNTSKTAELYAIIKENVRKNKIVKLQFRKKDGSLRDMTLLRSKQLEDSVKHTAEAATDKRKWTLCQNGMMVCEELTPEKTFQWRTINLNTVTKLTANGETKVFD